MRTILRLALIGTVLTLLDTSAALAQAGGPGWSPPSRQMPSMPRLQELSGDWLSPRANWFRGVDRVSGLTREQIAALIPSGDPNAGSRDFAQFIRFSDGPLPVVVWSDRNADTRSDLIEIYRRGGVIVQLIDADYDGQANAMRVYDPSGELLREERF